MTDTQKVFNLLGLLTDEQRQYLGARFNKTWQTPRLNTIREMQKKYSVDFFTAAFTVSVIEDANNLISAKKVSQVSERMYELAGELFRTPENVTAALRDIETAFDKLDEVQQKTAGIKFRNSVLKGFAAKMGLRILEMVTEKLGVHEQEWIAAK